MLKKLEEVKEDEIVKRSEEDLDKEFEEDKKGLEAFKIDEPDPEVERLKEIKQELKEVTDYTTFQGKLFRLMANTKTLPEFQRKIEALGKLGTILSELCKFDKDTDIKEKEIGFKGK